MPSPLRSLFWPLLGATAAHAAFGWGVFAQSEAAAPGAHTVLAMTLVAAPASPRAVVTPEARLAPEVEPPPAPAPAPASRLDVAARDLPAAPPPPATAAPAAAQAAPARATQPGAEPGAADVRVVAQSERFYRTDELTRLPGLNGEPLIDLGEHDPAFVGSVALRLFIDETGRVVDHRSEGSEGIPQALVDKLTRAFTGYPYVPGQRDGLAVRSQVTLIIGVREGQATMGAAQ